MRSGRWACQAAKATMMEAVEVKATCGTMADQPEKGGRWSVKNMNTRPKKRSMEARFPNSCLVQVGGKQERFFCRLGFQDTTAMAPRVAWRKSDPLQSPIACI